MAKKTKKNLKRRRAARTRRTVVGIIILALVVCIAYMLLENPKLVGSLNLLATPVPTAFVTPTPEPTLFQETPEPTAVPTPSPEPTATPVPTPEPTPRGVQEIDPSSLSADVLPGRDAVKMNGKIYANGEEAASYQRNEGIRMTDSASYTALEGITTFRGNNYRDGASYGPLPTDASTMAIKYSFGIGAIDNWSGVGWTGQPAIVRWDEATRRGMNLYADKKEKSGLVEVIYAAMDGKIYFFDLDDGSATRDPISIGAPIKGSVTIDPRGYPLMYVGQGIDTVNGAPVKIGMRIFSLIDQSELFFLDGRDSFATRGWYASDCAPLVDAATDTLIWSGENGLFYTIALNSAYDPQAGTVSVNPTVDRFWYESKVTTRPGMENSVAIYNHYAYFADNSGLITCLDLNTMTPVWSFIAGDDTDASLVLKENEDGTVYLYTGSELDLSAKNGTGTIYLRCLNALTGAEIWNKPVKISDTDDVGGMYATPALGKGSVENLVYFTVARTVDENGKRVNMLYALDQKTGAVAWEISTGGYSWSSPTLAYDANGRAYLFQANANGNLKMIDAQTGTIITDIDLGSNVEGSPAIFGNTLVVGTRGQKIYGVTIN